MNNLWSCRRNVREAFKAAQRQFNYLMPRSGDSIGPLRLPERGEDGRIGGMAAHPKVPYGVMDFRRIREKGYCSVDRTSYIRKMEERGGFDFFVRPRRMGKSLFVDTLRRFQFRGAALHRLEQTAGEAM